jgi:hypothetical protein
MDQRAFVERGRRGDRDAFAVLAGGAIARLDAAARLILRDRELATGRYCVTVTCENMPALKWPGMLQTNR